jgi:hypothetical protein
MQVNSVSQRGRAATKNKPLKHGGTEEAEETKTLHHEGTQSKDGHKGKAKKIFAA